MTTKKTSTTTNQYNQGAENAYNQMIPQATGALSSEINNPYNNMFFNNQVGMLNQQTGAMGSSGQSAINQSLQARGLGANSPLSAYMGRMNTNQTRANQAQGYNGLLLNAANMRQSAISGAMNFNPQQMGQTNVQQQSGLGTWLPQLAGAAIGAGMGAMTGGATTMMGNMGGNFGGNSLLSSYANGGGPNYSQPGPAPNVQGGPSGNFFIPGQGY